MKSVIIALLAGTALAAPALAQNTTQPPQSQMQPQNNQKPKAQPQKQSQAQPQQAPQQKQQQAANRKPISPTSLNNGQIRQMQTALDKDGFKAGRADGIWGPQTRAALEGFQKSKGMTSNGQLTQNTMTALGVNVNAPRQTHG